MIDRFWVPKYIKPGAEEFSDTPRGYGYFGPGVDVYLSYQDIPKGVGIYSAFRTGWNLPRSLDNMAVDLQFGLRNAYNDSGINVDVETFNLGGETYFTCTFDFPDWSVVEEGEVFIAADNAYDVENILGLKPWSGGVGFGGEVHSSQNAFIGSSPYNPATFWSPRVPNLDGRTFSDFTAFSSTFNFGDGYQNIFDIERRYKRFSYRPVEGKYIREGEDIRGMTFEEFFLTATNELIYVDSVASVEDFDKNIAVTTADQFKVFTEWSAQEELLSFEEKELYSVNFKLEVVDD